MNARRAQIHKEFQQSRKIAFAAADDSCVKCGNLARDAHHVYGPADNRPEHLRPLCRWCHAVAPMGDAYWEWEAAGESGPDRLIRDCLPRIPDQSPEAAQMFRSMVMILGEFGVSLAF